MTSQNGLEGGLHEIRMPHPVLHHHPLFLEPVMAITLKEIVRRSRDFNPKQIPQVLDFLSKLAPYDELAYRMVLRGAFMRCRGSHWDARIKELQERFVHSTRDMQDLITYCDVVHRNLGFTGETPGSIAMRQDGR